MLAYAQFCLLLLLPCCIQCSSTNLPPWQGFLSHKSASASKHIVGVRRGTLLSVHTSHCACFHSQTTPKVLVDSRLESPLRLHPLSSCPGCLGTCPGHQGTREVSEAAIHTQSLEVVVVLLINGTEGWQVPRLIAQGVQVDLAGRQQKQGGRSCANTSLLSKPTACNSIHNMRWQYTGLPASSP
jgi:hypothetical protein